MRFRNEAENAYSFTKYECNKYKKVITHDKILQGSQTLLAEARESEKEKATRERYHDDRYKAVCRSKDQAQIELEQAHARIESIQVENDYIMKQIERNRSEW